MEIYSTEEQQVEAIKQFWKDYGSSIVIGAVVGLGGLFAWNSYSEMKVSKAEAASAAYETLSQNLNDESALIKAAESFNAEHDQAGYGLLVEMMVAKGAVDAKDYAKAEASLKQVIANKDSGVLGQVAALRLARVQAEQGQAEQALSTLATVTVTAFEALREEIKGDILAGKGDIEQARAAYQAALDKGGIAASPMLRMKLDNLTQA